MKWWCTSYNISFLALSFDGVCEFHLDEIWENCIESSVNSGRGSWCHWKRNRESRERERVRAWVLWFCTVLIANLYPSITDARSSHLGSSNQQPINLDGILSLARSVFTILSLFCVFFSLFISLLLVVSVYLSRISFFRQLVVVCVYFLQSLLFGFRVQRHRPENKNYTSSVCS